MGEIFLVGGKTLLGIRHCLASATDCAHKPPSALFSPVYPDPFFLSMNYLVARGNAINLIPWASGELQNSSVAKRINQRASCKTVFMPS
jgi:hypothetical protein